MSIIAIITARGGSKRIPHKNIKNFMGRPMLAYAIDAASKAEIFDEIMVSTDSENIATVAKQYGAKVPFLRSEKTSGDFATTYDVLEEVLTEYGQRGKVFDSVCCIYPCVPFLKSETLKRAYAKYNESGATGILPVCQYPVPVEWAMKINEGYLEPNDSEALLIRSQDLEPKYYDAGMFYLCNTEVMLKEKSLLSSKTMAMVIDELECQDIDTLNDWNMAEIKYKLLQEEV